MSTMYPRLRSGSFYVSVDEPNTVKVVAQTYTGCDSDRKEAHDYARLFAAAPDMLEALKAVDRWSWEEGYTTMVPAIAAVIAAIAKASTATETASKTEGAS